MGFTILFSQKFGESKWVEYFLGKSSLAAHALLESKERNLLVQTRELSKRYGSFWAVNNCTLTIGQGEIFGLLGPNGAGKTTLLRLLLGFLRPSFGTATIDSLDCYQQSPMVHRLVAYLPGDVRLFAGMRGSDVLQFLGDMRGISRERSRRLASAFELDLTRRVAYMSTGMRQKLALAATFAADTPLLILDEPTSNLDPTMRATVAQLVREAQSQKRTVIFSSHVLSEVEEVCDQVAILRGGCLVHMQAMNELRRRHRVCAKFKQSLPQPPDHIRETIELGVGAAGELVIETSSELMPLLRWLSELDLEDLSIEHAGLKSVYGRFHPQSPKQVQFGT